MKAPFPSPIENWHNDTYSSIDPTRPEVSMVGKNVIITGGGAGIGRGAVESFAKAKAASIIITGRRPHVLEDTKKYIEGKYGVRVQTFAADVTDVDAMKKVAAEVGSWDVLVNNAGYMSTPGLAKDADINEWWKGFEINLKGTLVVWQSFHATANKGAVFIGTATGAVSLPTSLSVGQTSYVASKLGLIKFLEVLAAEETDISVRFLHPGVVDTDMADKSGMKDKLPIDAVELPSDFTVWLASPEGAFLAGRMVSCNWDIEELKAVAHAVPESQIFKSAVSGWSGPSLAELLKL